jgi:C1A family cysteine protease
MHKNGCLPISYWANNTDPLIQPQCVIDSRNQREEWRTECFKIASYERINSEYTYEIKEMMKAVLSVERLPTIFGVMLYENAVKEARKTGFLELPKKGDRQIGGHAMWNCGWLTLGKRDYLLAPNSWGNRVGNDGDFIIDARYIDEGYIRDVWTVPKVYY